MRSWILQQGLAGQMELDTLEKKARKKVQAANKKAWHQFQSPNEKSKARLSEIYNHLQSPSLLPLKEGLAKLIHPVASHLLENAREAMLILRKQETAESLRPLELWIAQTQQLLAARYHTHLHSHSDRAALLVSQIDATYDADAPWVNGFEILNAFFDTMLAKYDNLCAFGEDLGKIGDVNQGFAGLQDKYGPMRVADTGIREWTIIGQAIGMAQRGLRPIAEIQYLDYLAYGFAPLTDDLATLRYRTNGIQHAPVIVRTRGHRLEGIWHSGSPLGMIIHSMRGIYVLVPRNMTQAAGMYHTMLQSDDPAIIIECLNGYRVKEKLPNNLSEFRVALGIPEILTSGSDVTLVTYGSCIRIALEAVQQLSHQQISVELVDVQTLLPFDLPHIIVSSLRKTNRILFLDEDVPGGATAYMMQQVLEVQGGYRYLDAPPKTLSAQPHRPAFGDDGDYASKPNVGDVVDHILAFLD